MRYNGAAELLKGFANRTRGISAGLVALGLIQVGMTILLAYSVANMLQGALFASTQQLPTALDWWLMGTALIGKALAAYAQSRLGNWASIQIRAALRSYVLQAVYARNIQLLAQVRAAELTNLLSTQIDALREYFSDFVPQRRLAVLMPIAVLIAAATVNWLVALILLVTAPLVPVFMMLVGRKAAQANRENLNELNRLGNLLADRLRHLQALQLVGTQAQEAESLFHQSERFRTSTMRVLRLAFLSGTLLEFFSAISVALVAVYLGLFFLGKYDVGAWTSGLTLGDGVFLLMLAPEFYLPLRRLGALYHAKAEATSVAEAVVKITQGQDEAAANRKDVPLLETLTLQQVMLGSQPVDLTLQKGEVLLLTGPSGSGKTTLLDALAGLRPLGAGQVVINAHTHAAPAALYREPSWFQQVGYMTQQPELLHASIRDNLSLGRTFSDEQLMAALHTAQVDDVVAALPEGLDYLVTDGGGYLSGGQAQRIALARVFLHQPKLLILDEPTASLDADTAARFLESLCHYRDQGGRVIIATHRDIAPLSSTYHMDAEQGALQ